MADEESENLQTPFEKRRDPNYELNYFLRSSLL